jgi:hypothetical protein
MYRAASGHSQRSTGSWANAETIVETTVARPLAPTVENGSDGTGPS